MHISTIPIGGLTEVGISRSCSEILAISYDGRGLLNKQTGEVLARDPNPAWQGYEPHRLQSPGIGTRGDCIFSLAGIYGGGLSLVTADGWSIEIVDMPWPNKIVYLLKPDGKLENQNTRTRISPKRDSSLVCCGFTFDGDTFIYATSSDLTIYGRKTA